MIAQALLKRKGAAIGGFPGTKSRSHALQKARPQTVTMLKRRGILRKGGGRTRLVHLPIGPQPDRRLSSVTQCLTDRLCTLLVLVLTMFPSHEAWRLTSGDIGSCHNEVGNALVGPVEKTWGIWRCALALGGWRILAAAIWAGRGAGKEAQNDRRPEILNSNSWHIAVRAGLRVGEWVCLHRDENQRRGEPLSIIC